MASMITARNVDLSNCDREQVQFSGAGQPHGCLLVIDPSTLRILQASTNTEDVLGLPHARVCEAHLETVLGRRSGPVADRLGRDNLESGPVLLASLTAEDVGSGRPINLFGHRSAGSVILEFEVIPSGDGRPMLDLYSELRATISELQTTKSLNDFFALAVQRIRLFTGFERVMAYKFLEDGAGDVIAEDVTEGLEPYLGLRYPAVDIPAPARRLFSLSWLRHLPDVHYRPVPIVPERNPVTGDPLDQSYGMLRSVSAMYSGYLKNMGAKSTMVMPLMREGKLWGLISCMHHAAPRHVAYEARMASEFLAHMLSLMMSAKEDAETFAYRLRMKALLDSMMLRLDERADLHAGLGGGNDTANIANYIDCGGAALVTEDQITKMGSTPDDAAIRDLSRWLSGSSELVVSTDRLGEAYAPAEDYAKTAAGLLAVRLSRRRPEFAMWFRPEQAETVNWAGNPEKAVEVDDADGTVRLKPRASFALWKQSVKGRAKPWADFEVKAAADLRWAMVEVILARAEETERLNRELKDVNIELDSFAYIASHDLKEPLRGIHHLATFLQRGLGDRIDDDSRQQIETIMRLTKRMDDLIESLLQYSRTGRADLLLEDCDLDDVVSEVLLTLRRRIEETRTEIRRSTRLPVVRADRVRVRELMTNLISNAIKYNDKAERWIEIGCEPGNPPAISVKDNGIGIAERNFTRMFEIFRRLHGRDEFGGGSGAGLTIAKRTVERHGGRIWLTSEPGEGSTFYFTLQPSEDGQCS